jgi:hypothetical protein
MSQKMGAERNRNSETISLREKHSEKNIYTHKEKSNVERQNQ